MVSEAIAPMTSRQRVLAALNREPVDRTPLCNPTSVATVELMDLVDAPFPEANREPELMARLAATYGVFRRFFQLKRELYREPVEWGAMGIALRPWPAAQWISSPRPWPTWSTAQSTAARNRSGSGGVESSVGR